MYVESERESDKKAKRENRRKRERDRRGEVQVGKTAALSVKFVSMANFERMSGGCLSQRPVSTKTRKAAR